MFSFKEFIPVFSFLFSVLKNFRSLFAIQLCIAFITGINEPIRSYLFKLIFNSATETVLTHNFEQLWSVTIWFCISQVAVISNWRLYDFVIPRLRALLRQKAGILLSERVLRHSNLFYQEYLSGSLANKINDVVKGIPTIQEKITEGLLTYILQFSISIYIAYQVNVYIALIMLIWILASITFSVLVFPLLEKYGYQAARARSTIVGQLVDTISNMTNIHLFGGSTTEQKHLNSTIKNAYDSECKRDWFFLKINAIQAYSFIIVQSICLYILIKGLQNNTLTVGDFALILSLTGAVIQKLWYLADDLRRLAEEFGSVKQGLAEIMLPFDMLDAAHAQPLHIKQATIVFEDVHFNYKGRTSLFQKKSIRILPQQKVGLVGFSGSGKSTFVKLILRLFDIQSGRITIDGQDIAQVTQESLRSAIAMIPQEPTLFQRSIMENIRYARPNATDQEVIEAAKKAHADDFIIQLTDSYNTIVGPQGSSLSGGQRQRIAIARAILKNAPILIFDEATSQLDSVTEILIQKSLHELMQDKTTLIIAHRLSTLLHMDRILVFDKGHIVQDGTHQELLAQEGLYKILWNTQSNGFLSDTPSNK